MKISTAEDFGSAGIVDRITTVICGADVVIEQGDLYDRDALPNF
jgi:hypothetical protein